MGKANNSKLLQIIANNPNKRNKKLFLLYNKETSCYLDNSITVRQFLARFVIKSLQTNITTVSIIDAREDEAFE